MIESSTGDNCVKLKFRSEGFLLNGTLHLPRAKKPPVVIGVHGLASSGDSPKQIALAQRCNSLGMAYFRFDHRGCGESEGVFEEVTSLDSRCRDLSDAIKTLGRRGDLGEKIGLFGSSMGGTTALRVAGKIRITAMVVLATPTNGSSIVREPSRLDEFQRLSPEFYDRHINFDIEEYLAGQRNILVIHGDRDEIVPVENAVRIFERAQEPKKMILQKGGDHRVSNPDHQKPFIEEASLWFRRFLLNP